MADEPAPTEVSTEQQQHSKKLVRWLAIFYVVLPLLLIYLLFKVFPPYPWPTNGGSEVLVDSLPIKFIGGLISVSTTLDERLLLLVIVAGALGSFIHSATSFSSYIGNKQFSESWTLWYVLRPLIGAGLALVLYFVTRGGLVLLVNNGVDVTNASKINPFGTAGIAGLTGMFSKQAADKLADVFSTLFKSSADDQRKDSLNAPPPVITNIDPADGPVAGGTRITIVGTGFAAGAKVLLGGLPATNIEIVSDTTIKADTPAHDAGVVDVQVLNADGTNATNAGGYEYVAGGSENGTGDAAAIDAAVNSETNSAVATVDSAATPGSSASDTTGAGTNP